MRVLFEDSLALNPAGTGAFVRGLRTALQARGDVEVLSAGSALDGSADLNVEKKGVTRRIANAGRHFRYFLYDLPTMARARGCDAIFCPSSLGPLRGATPSYITLFDLSPLAYSGTMDQLSGAYVRAMLQRGLRRSAGICTISEAVAAEIRERFPRLPAARIGVAYPGPNPGLLEALPSPAPVGDAPFLLMVGTLEPRKNHITAFKAMAAHLQRRPESPLRLVLAGSAGWRYQPALRIIQELGLEQRVLRLGKVELGVLKWLYQHARGLLFPSLYEGFGLPVLEAMYLGCPVIAARIPSVLEITTAESALLLEPVDVQAWTAALDAAAQNAFPAAMVEVGRQRSQRFSWSDCAASVVRLITGSPAVSS